MTGPVFTSVEESSTLRNIRGKETPVAAGELYKTPYVDALGSFAGPPPTNLQDAIDRIGAAVSALLAGPIP